MTNSSTILKVENLKISFSIEGQIFQAIEDISFFLKKGEILSIVGESGCGKTVTCLSLTKLLPEPPAIYESGSIKFYSQNIESKNILEMSPSEICKIRRHIVAHIFQEPSVSLNPVFTIFEQISEVIDLRTTPCKNHKEEVISLLAQVGVPDPEKKMMSYPHELSGGMQQRAMIAMALAAKPQILIADEPTTALDVTIQAQILDLIKELKDKNNMSVILITHNLGIVSEVANNVIVMYAGHIVEKGSSSEIIANPLHPYTKSLLSTVPRFGNEQKKLSTIPGTVPSPSNYPPGCRFFGRCPLAEQLTPEKRKLCENSKPELKNLNGRFSKCHFSE